MSNVRVRFAPSPTGFVHIGSLRTALYNYLFAKKMGGEYILRVEDTDRTRLVDGAIENMLNAMKWAGVNHTEGVMLDDNGNVVQKGDCGPYIQSERLDIYQKYIQELLDSGKAYYCFCTKDRLEEVIYILGDKWKTSYMVAADMTWEIDCKNWLDFPAPQKWFATGET